MKLAGDDVEEEDGQPVVQHALPEQNGAQLGVVLLSDERHRGHYSKQIENERMEDRRDEPSSAAQSTEASSMHSYTLR